MGTGSSLPVVGDAFLSGVSSAFMGVFSLAKNIVLFFVDLIRFAISNPIMFFGLLGLLIFSIIWFPFHHVILEGVQIGYTDIARPLGTQLVVPILHQVDPIYRVGAGLANFYMKFPMTFGVDMLLVPLRCNETGQLFDTVISGVTPFTRTVTLLSYIEATAISGKQIDVNMTQLTVAISFDYLANLSASLSGFSGCYCSVLGYAFDALTLILIDDDLRCLVSNYIGFLAEIQTVGVNLITETVTLVANGISWLLCIITRACDAPRPHFDMATVLYDITRLEGYFNAFWCCMGDFMDSVLSGILDVVRWGLEGTFFPGEHGATVPVRSHIKVGGPVRSILPATADTVVTMYDILRGVSEHGYNVSYVNITKLFDYYAAICHETADTIQSYGPIIGNVLSGFATGPIPDPLLMIYGPMFLNHTCMASVRLVEAAIKIAVEVRSYNDYVNGSYMDCVFSELELATTGGSASVTHLVNILAPSWRTCSAPFNKSWVCVPGTDVCMPAIVCKDRAFDNAVGDVAVAPIRLIVAALEYVEDISTNSQTFDRARRVSSDCIFDEIDRTINASSSVMRQSINQIPLSIIDIENATRIFGNISTAYINVLLSGDGGEVMNEFAESVASYLESVEILNLMIEPMNGGPPRPLGLGDFIPGIVPLQTWPEMINATGFLINGILRFIAATVHTADFEHWEFDPRVLGSLVERQLHFAKMASLAITWAPCIAHRVSVAQNWTTTDNNLTSCPLHAKVEEMNIDICPLNLIPCPAGPLEHLIVTLERLLDIIPRLVLYSENDFLMTMFDPPICEFETAVAELDQAFSEWHLMIEIPYWHGVFEIDPGGILSSNPYALAKILDAGNAILVELINTFVSVKHKDPQCNSTTLPIWDSGSATCITCIDAGIPIGSACPGAGGYCSGSGRCSGRAPNGTVIDNRVLEAIGSVLHGVEQFYAPLGIIDPNIPLMYREAFAAPMSLVKAILDITLSKVKDDGVPISVALMELTCMTETYAKAASHLLLVPVGVVGRIAAMIAEFAGAKHLPSDIRESTSDLQRGMMGVLNSTIGIATGSAKAVLGIIGASIDAAAEGKNANVYDWLGNATVGICVAQDALDSLPVAVRNFVLSLDVAKTGLLCEIAELAQAYVAVPVLLVKQITGVIGVITQSPYLQHGVSIDDFIMIRLLVCYKTGTAISGTIYNVLSLMVKDEQARAFLFELTDAIGAIIGSTLNILWTTTETEILFVAWIAKSAEGSFGVLKDIIPICGLGQDPFSILRPMFLAASSWLRAFGRLAAIVWEPFGDIANVIADLMEDLLVNPDSKFVKLITAGLDVVMKFVAFVASVVTGGDAAEAGKDLVDSIVTFFKILWTVFKGILFDLINNIIFGGKNFNGHTIIGCLSEFEDCFIGWIEDRLADLLDEIKDTFKDFGNDFCGAFHLPCRDDSSISRTRKALLDIEILLDSIPEGDFLCYDLVDKMRVVYSMKLMTMVDGIEFPPEDRWEPTAVEKTKLILCANRAMDEGMFGEAVCRQMGLDVNMNPESKKKCEILSAKKNVITWGTASFMVHELAMSILYGSEGETNSESIRNRIHSAQKTIGPLISSGMTMMDDDIKQSTTTMAKEGMVAERMFMNLFSFDHTADDIIDEAGEHECKEFSHLKRALDEINAEIDRDAREVITGSRDIQKSTIGSGGQQQQRDILEHYVEGCGHNYTIPGWGIYFDDTYTLFDSCPDSCPGCYDKKKTFSVLSACPITRCPGVVASNPALIGMCARVCASAYNSEAFKLACFPYLENTTHAELWGARVASYLAGEGGYTNFTGTNRSITEWDVLLSLDSDLIVIETTNGTYIDGPLKASDTCTEIAVYGRPRAEYCRNKCSLSSNNSEIMRVRYGLSSLTAQGKTFLAIMCRDFCMTDYSGCRNPSQNIQCTSDAESMAACLTTCDMKYDPTVNLFESSIAPCRPSLSMECFAGGAVVDEPEETSDSALDLESTCICPSSPNSTKCHCEYTFEYTQPTTKFYSMPFLCPRQARDPIFHILDDLDYEALSAAIRPARGETIIISPSVTYDPNTNTPPNIFGVLQSAEELTPPLTSCNNITCSLVTTTLTDIQLCGYDEYCAAGSCTEQIVTVTDLFYINNASITPGTPANTSRVWSDCTYWLLSDYTWDSNLNGSNCVDRGVDGWCDTTSCDISATFTAPVGDNCISNYHCAKGLWCPRSDKCLSSTGSGEFDACFSIPYTCVDESIDGVDPNPYAIEITRDATVCIGRSWSTWFRYEFAPAGGVCTTPDVINATLLPDLIDGQRAWIRDPWSDAYQVTAYTYCIIGANPGESVKLCGTTLACDGVPGCEPELDGCSFCPPECRDPYDPSPPWYCMTECKYCDLPQICLDLIGDVPMPGEVVQAWGGPTKAGCAVQPTQSCGSFYTADETNAQCTATTFPSTELGSAPRTITLDNNTVPYPWTFSANNIPCFIEYVHTGDFCSYLCRVGDGEDIQPTNCYNALGYGLLCSAYRMLTDPNLRSTPAARRWLCDRLPGEDLLTADTYPILGIGTVPIEDKEENDALPFAQKIWRTVDLGFPAQMCPTPSGVGVATLIGTACVMRGPDPSDYWEQNAAPENSCECGEMGEWLTPRYKDLLETAVAQWPGPSLPDNGGYNIPIDTPTPISQLPYTDGLIIPCGYAGCETIRGQLTPWPSPIIPTSPCIGMGGGNGSGNVTEDECTNPSEQCVAGTCEIPSISPQPCNRNVDPRPLPSGCVPRTTQCKRRMHLPCEEFFCEYREHPEDVESAYEEWEESLTVITSDEEERDKETKTSSLRSRILAKREGANGVKRTPGVRGQTEGSGLLKDFGSTLALILEQSACAAMPWTAPCKRLDSAIARIEEETGKKISRNKPYYNGDYYSLHHAKNKKENGGGNIQIRSIGDALGATVMDSRAPPPGAVAWDCYILCGYDWDDLFRRLCLWQTFSREGAVGDVFDALEIATDAVCHAAGLGNGTQRFGNGSMTIDTVVANFNFSKFVVRRPNITDPATAIVGAGIIASKSTALTIWFLKTLFGIQLENGTLDEILLGATASLVGLNSSTQMLNATVNWATNVNLDVDKGKVGLLYAALFFSPWSVSCDKLNGTHQFCFPLWGDPCDGKNGTVKFCIPFYWILWVPYFPTWVVGYAHDALKWLFTNMWIVPKSMVLDPGGCQNQTHFCIPFTDECDCYPSFENCGERLGFSTPFHTLAYALERWFPSITHNWIFQSITWITSTSGMFERFRDASQFPDACDYDYCFVITFISTIGIILIIPLIIYMMQFIMEELISFGKMIVSMVVTAVTFLFFSTPVGAGAGVAYLPPAIPTLGGGGLGVGGGDEATEPTEYYDDFEKKWYKKNQEDGNYYPIDSNYIDHWSDEESHPISGEWGINNGSSVVGVSSEGEPSFVLGTSVIDAHKRKKKNNASSTATTAIEYHPKASSSSSQQAHGKQKFIYK